jgi:hypothetical protein
MLTAEREALFDLLVRRVNDARGKAHLEQLLKDLKAEQNIPAKALKATGSKEELATAVKIAADKGWLTERRLADLVDHLEENGGQHIFLFDLTARGVARLTRARLAEAFTEIPARPTAALYATLPTAKRTYLIARPDALVVKQVFKAEYWEKDEEKSKAHTNDDERATFVRRRERRAINLFRIQPEQRLAEMRIDRVRGDRDDALALDLAADFLKDLEPALTAAEDLAPLDIRRGLRQMAADRTDIYLNADDAVDASAQMSLANRRERDRGPDIRDHVRYQLDGDDCARERLSPYWIIDGDEDNKVFTHLSVVDVDGIGECGKIYVSATLEPAVLNHVLDRIRHFARPTP